MKAIRGILPWAVVLAAVGGLTWWLLSRDLAAGRWLLAAVLVGHGAVHLMFAVPAPAAAWGGPPWPFDMAKSWAVTKAGLDFDVARIAGVALIVVTVGGLAIAALSTVGIVVPAGLWQPAVAVAAAASAIVLVLFFDPQLVVGLGIDAVLLWAVLTRAWAP